MSEEQATGRSNLFGTKILKTGLLLSGACGLLFIGLQSQVVAENSNAMSNFCSMQTDGLGGVEVVALATAFRQSLNDEQKARLVQDLTLENAIRWSNYPPAIISRAGVSYRELDPEQTVAADALLRAVAGSCGFEAFEGNRLADGLSKGVMDYIGSGEHYISFHGEPSETAPWTVMAGGHHLAYNFTFNALEPGATPMLVGSDPAHFTDQSGQIREPLGVQSNTWKALASSLVQHEDAQIPGNFTGLVKSVRTFRQVMDQIDISSISRLPGELRPGVSAGSPDTHWRAAFSISEAIDNGRIAGTDLNYPMSFEVPANERGIRFGNLTPEEQNQVRDSIRVFAKLGGQMADKLLIEYLRPDALVDTYIGLSGDPSLTVPGGYLRIDGPRLWIEVTVQSGHYDPAVPHFHALWRDKLADYGAQFRM